MDKLVKYILFMLFVTVLGHKSYGQIRGRIIIQRRDPMERLERQPAPQRRLEQIKESFIARQLNLSPAQSRVFWPLYRQYVQERTVVRIEIRDNNSNRSPNGTTQIDNELKYETELVNIRKHYRDEFLKILTPDQLSLLYKSELQFNDEMVKQLSERGVPVVN